MLMLVLVLGGRVAPIQSVGLVSDIELALCSTLA